MNKINLTKKYLEEINKENSQINVEPVIDINSNLIGFSLCMKIITPIKLDNICKGVYADIVIRADQLPIKYP